MIQVSYLFYDGARRMGRVVTEFASLEEARAYAQSKLGAEPDINGFNRAVSADGLEEIEVNDVEIEELFLAVENV